MIDYQHPARDAATPIGRFRATGPGSLHYVLDPTKPEQVFQAAWQTSVELGREKGQPVLTLDGRPQLAFARSRLARRPIGSRCICASWRATRRRDWRFVPANGDGDGSKLQIAPDRLIADGQRGN